MAAGKTSQSNTSLVALVVFIVLFLFSAVFAVILYTKYEDQKALTASAEAATAKLANRSEQGALESKIVGSTKNGKSYIGTMSDYFNEMVKTVVGELPGTTAAAKFNDAKREINKTIAALDDDATAVPGEDNFDLLNTIGDLKTKLDAAREEAAGNAETISELNDEIELNRKQFREENAELIAAKDRAMESERTVATNYDELKESWDKLADEQIQLKNDKLEAAEEKQKQQNLEMAELADKLKEATFQLDEALAKIESIKSTPDNQVMAFKADATVFTADLQNGLIYLNIGSKDHVYPGLTFSIFDRNAPIPKDGKGKAEIEVFRVSQSSCVAKVLTSSKRDPVIKNDIAVNMIWNSKTSNTFMVIGEFDFDGNGLVDRNGKAKIEQMIKQWNGRLVKGLTIDTDFLVVGTEPKEMDKPTIQQIENDPGIEETYEKSIAKFNEYEAMLDKAKVLSVPVFNRQRFMQLTGYETIAEKSTPITSKK